MNPFRTESSFPAVVKPWAGAGLERFHPREAVASEPAAISGLAASALAALHAATGAAKPAQPRLQLLSNGRYHVMVTAGGGGYSNWQGLALTRWREHAACDGGGSFCYFRDLDTGHIWSTTLLPTLSSADSSSAAFPLGSAVFERRDHDISVQTVIAVSLEDDVELRRVRITNHGVTDRTLELTSYAEIVLGSATADRTHPAFENLFVETEILRESQAIVCHRRRRAPEDRVPWLFHMLAAASTTASSRMPVSMESDRARFIGRGRNITDPQAMDNDATLSGTAGPVLDPVAAIRCCVSLGAGETTTLDLITGVGSTRDECDALIGKYQSSLMADRVLEGAPRYAQSVLGASNSAQTTEAQVDEAQAYAALAVPLLFETAAWRAGSEVLARNRQGQSGLWRYGISGDLPMALLSLGDDGHMELAAQLLRAHAYWRQLGLPADLVILTANAELQRQVLAEVSSRGGAYRLDKAGGVFVRLAGEIEDADQVLLKTVSRLVVDAEDGPLPQQLARRPERPPATGARPPAWPHPLEEPPQPDIGLQFRNGLGGFTPDGLEYVITVTPGQMTPLPWINVLANAEFGTLVSESGSASTWSENAQMFRLTPWSNDAVSDPNTEAFILRDEQSGHNWSLTLLPCPGTGAYVTRHGFGYSVFEHSEGDIDSELTLFVALDAPVKFAVMKISNRAEKTRRLSISGQVSWVLGDERAKTAMHVSAFVDESGALLAGNAYNTDFAGRTAFFDFDGGSDAKTSHGDTLSLAMTLAAGESRELVFRLGCGKTADEARALIQHWRGAGKAQEALRAVKQYWTHTLSALRVETPDPSLDILVNGWLPYQTLACRLWARNAFSQSSGAFGFRDQLQDVMALVHATPALVREHLLRCASQQFPEGDVLHWWHPASDGHASHGIRTRCSDDYLWLALATCRYVSVTGDAGVLDESVSYLQGEVLKDGQDSSYEPFAGSDLRECLYEHCKRAVIHGLRYGAHGLPLMGAGDWNDGMNLVGPQGRGESVWLGFFLGSVLAQFGALAGLRGDAEFSRRCETEAGCLRDALEASAWDGNWWRRGWFDDGSPLGSAANAECQIDAIAQSWSVLSGAADPGRARLAMEAVNGRLVDHDASLIKLLSPPFERSDPSPGYIQGYVAGVRENGGQYTHAAVWSAMAFAALGDVERAWELFGMLNPIRHADSNRAIGIYRAEPYVIASDVYALPPHTGRGGWTWYTGAAGWMLRFITESLLGLKVQANTLQISPCVPRDWDSYVLNYQYLDTLYRIEVRKSHGSASLLLDGTALAEMVLPLVNDRGEHLAVFQIPGTEQCKTE